jgi:hypothetical protein
MSVFHPATYISRYIIWLSDAFLSLSVTGLIFASRSNSSPLTSFRKNDMFRRVSPTIDHTCVKTPWLKRYLIRRFILGYILRNLDSATTQILSSLRTVHSLCCLHSPHSRHTLHLLHFHHTLRFLRSAHSLLTLQTSLSRNVRLPPDTKQPKRSV